MDGNDATFAPEPPASAPVPKASSSQPQQLPGARPQAGAQPPSTSKENPIDSVPPIHPTPPTEPSGPDPFAGLDPLIPLSTKPASPPAGATSRPFALTPASDSSPDGGRGGGGGGYAPDSDNSAESPRPGVGARALGSGLPLGFSAAQPASSSALRFDQVMAAQGELRPGSSAAVASQLPASKPGGSAAAVAEAPPGAVVRNGLGREPAEKPAAQGGRAPSATSVDSRAFGSVIAVAPAARISQPAPASAGLSGTILPTAHVLPSG